MSIYPGGVPHGPPGPPVPSEQGRVGILSRLPTLMTLPFFFQTGQQCSGGPHSPGAGSEIVSTTEGSVVSVLPPTVHTKQWRRDPGEVGGAKQAMA